MPQSGAPHQPGRESLEYGLSLSNQQGVTIVLKIVHCNTL